MDSELWLGLFGGIGLFLYGMTLMSTGIRQACGSRLHSILERATTNKWRGALVGTGLTMLVQSSAATGVMVIDFVDSGLMTLAQATGVILGANVGTTVTAQITAFHLSAAAPVMIFLGTLAYLFVKKKPMIRSLGLFLLGFGMLFQGIGFMKDAIAPLAKRPEFINAVSRISSPLLLILISIVFTALLQSSSSSTVIFQAFAVEGLIDFRACVYLLVGAAIGSVAPNILAALTTERNGKRAALLNLLYNLIRGVMVVVAVGLFPRCLDLIRNLSPDDVGRQVANAHTIFALVTALLVLPFSQWLVKLAEKILPFKEEEIRRMNDYKLHYLTNPSLLAPGVALAQAKLELIRMGHIALSNLETAVSCFFEPTAEKERVVAEQEAVMDWLDRAIIEKLGQLRGSDMSAENMDAVYHMTLTVSDMERLSDLAENLAEHAVKLRERDVHFTEEGERDLREIADLALDSVRLAIEIFDTNAYDRLPEADALEQMVDDKQDQIISAHVVRLMHKSCQPLAGVIFTDFATEMERCSDHALNIAYSLSGRHEEKDPSSILEEAYRKEEG